MKAMKIEQTPSQKISLVAAALLGAAPLAFGLFGGGNGGHDLPILSMAVVATIFLAGVMAAAIGRRRSRHAVAVQSTIILVVSTLLAGLTAFVYNAGTGSDVWTAATLMGICLAASSVLLAVSRTPPRQEHAAG